MAQKAVAQRWARDNQDGWDVNAQIVNAHKPKKVKTAEGAAEPDWGQTSIGTTPTSTSSNPNSEIRRKSRAEAEVAGLNEEVKDKHKQTPLQRKFDLAMGGVIIVNVFWIAIEIDLGPEEGVKFKDRIFWWIINNLFLFTFIAEVVIRIFWERSRWPYGFWNWFDLGCVTSSVLDLWVLVFFEGDKNLKSMSILRLARLIRLLRMVKLVKNLHSLYVMVMAFLKALQNMAWLGVILFFGILIYAILATILIGRNTAFDDVRIAGDTVYSRFGTVLSSMYSLFELMTLEGWEVVSRPLVEAQPWVFLFIGIYIMIFTYGILNMIVATVVESTIEESQRMKKFDQKMQMKTINEQLLSLQDRLLHGDSDKSGSLTLEEFVAAMKDKRLAGTLASLGVPVEEAKQLFMVLDTDESGELTIPEIVAGLSKLTDGESPFDKIVMTASVRHLSHEVDRLHTRFDEQKELLQQLISQSGGRPIIRATDQRNGSKESPVVGYVATAQEQSQIVSQNRPAAPMQHIQLTDAERGRKAVSISPRISEHNEDGSGAVVLMVNSMGSSNAPHGAAYDPGKQSSTINAVNRGMPAERQWNAANRGISNDNDRRARIAPDNDVMRQSANMRDASPTAQPAYNDARGHGMSNDANMYGSSRRIQVQPPGVPLHHRNQPLASGQPRLNSATRRKHSPSPGAPVAT